MLPVFHENLKQFFLEKMFWFVFQKKNQPKTKPKKDALVLKTANTHCKYKPKSVFKTQRIHKEF